MYGGELTVGINVTSEIKPLKKVLLHRPGKEIENLTPEYLERLLFDDIPFLEVAQKEHDSFADTLRFSNAYLDSIGGDFDGDQCTCKGVYTREANDELEQFMHSKQNFVTFGCKPLKQPGSDSIQAMYALTKVLSDTTITPSDKIMYN